MRIDAFHRTRPCVHRDRLPSYEWIAENEGKPIVVSGFEPLDILQSIVMLLRSSSRRSQSGESIQARGSVGRQSRRSEGHGGSLRAAPLFRMARHGLHLAIRAAHPRKLCAEWDAEQRFQVPGVRVTDPKAAQCGEVLKGVLKPAQCKLFGKECTPEHPVGALMVSSEGSCAAYYQLRASQERGTRRHRRPENGDHCAPRKSDFRDPQIEMAHGAGGKASRRLVEGLFAPLLFGFHEPLGDAAHLDFNGARIAITADSFVVRRCVFPAALSASWPSTAR
jgi:hypothetical protein